MSDIMTPRQRSERMSRVKGKNSKPEMRLRSLIHRLGFRFRLHVKHLPGSPDIVLSRHRKIILMHGCSGLTRPVQKWADAKADIAITNGTFGGDMQELRHATNHFRTRSGTPAGGRIRHRSGKTTVERRTALRLLRVSLADWSE